MSETSFKRALDGAKLVRVYEWSGFAVIQVWHGGVGVNVYRTLPMSEYGDGFQEFDYWTMSDDEGHPYERDEYESKMDEHFDVMRAEWEGEL